MSGKHPREHVYLDHHAATPVCAAARRAMDEARGLAWANPSSAHAFGRRARAALEAARAQVAAVLGTDPGDVTLTSGGTEACNLGMLGLFHPGAAPRELVTTRIEHPAVAAVAARWEAAGTRVRYLDVRAGQFPSPDALDRLITEETDLVAVQWVNHETGTILPVPGYGRVCRQRGVRLFVDATQALGKLDLEATRCGATTVAVAAPKLGGPAGAGALWVERGVDLSPLLAGGSQERGRRPGSLDVVSQVGFGAACTQVQARRAAMPRIAQLRDRLDEALVELGGARNGAELPRVGSVANASFQGRRGEALVAALDLEGVCVSSGAACSSGLSSPSPVLAALYPDEPWRAASAVRMSLGPETRPSDVERAIEALGRVLARPAA